MWVKGPSLSLQTRSAFANLRTSSSHPVHVGHLSQSCGPHIARVRTSRHQWTEEACLQYRDSGACADVLASKSALRIDSAHSISVLRKRFIRRHTESIKVVCSVPGAGSLSGGDQQKKPTSLEGSKKMGATEHRPSNFWASIGWWIVVTISVPFALYSAVFVWGNFNIYRKMSVAWALGHHDTAGVNILNHLRAWQIHSLAAEAFLLTGPFQFSQKFRKAYPALHRQMGYVFVFATAVLIISGVTTLIPNSDFSSIGRTTFGIMAIFSSVFLVLAVKAAREKKFRVHQKFMIRTAALGYSVMSMRLIPTVMNVVTGLNMFWSLELAAVLAPVMFSGAAEIYIQKFLNQPKSA